MAAALPRALHARGHDVRVAMPCYRQIEASYRGEQYCFCEADYGTEKAYGALRHATVPGTDIPLYLIENDAYFGRETPYGTGAYEYHDNAERFCFFCLALLHAIPQTNWKPDIVHCNDWHAAPLPIYLKTRRRNDAFWGDVSSLFTIHNLGYQGRYDASLLGRTGMPSDLLHSGVLEYEGDMNLMKGALVLADKLNTVSPRYAREIQTIEYGAGLHDILSDRSEDLHGILNGVDYNVWNPAKDTHIKSNYDASDIRGKAVCKQALQRLFGLPETDVPLLGIVSRLHWQKGMDLLADAMDDIMTSNLQLVILGTGDPAIEEDFQTAATRYPKQLGLHLGFDSTRSHAVQAGSDFFLMPSRYEPCGLGQLYAMAYGTVPLVRRTGGLANTVRDYKPMLNNKDDATGLSFVPLTPQAVTRCIQTALKLYEDGPLLHQLRSNGMGQRYSWDRSSDEYESLYTMAMEQR